MDVSIGNRLGFHRAQVVDNEDSLKFGRVKVWVPDFMPLIPINKGLWARPANNMIGGRNSDGNFNYGGTSYIPPTGSWVWVFFECNNLNRPYYFAPLELENSKTLPECRVGSKYADKWVIFKSPDGRAIVISDDDSDARVEITGKKRQISEPPSGDEASVYTIDGNQTTILLDERSEKEKILIKTYKGDFLKLDIDDRKLEAFFQEGISLKTTKTFCVECKDFNVKATGSVKVEGSPVNIKSRAALNAQAAGGNLSIKSSAIVAIDGTSVSEMGGLASDAESAGSCNVNGGRDD